MTNPTFGDLKRSRCLNLIGEGLPDFQRTRTERFPSRLRRACKLVIFFCTDPSEGFRRVGGRLVLFLMSFLNLSKMVEPTFGMFSFISVETLDFVSLPLQSQSHLWCLSERDLRQWRSGLTNLVYIGRRVALGISVSDLHLFPCESWQIFGLKHGYILSLQ